MSYLPNLNDKVDENYMEQMKKNYWQRRTEQSINLSDFQEVMRQTERNNRLSRNQPVQNTGQLEVTLNRYLSQNSTASKMPNNKTTILRGRGEEGKTEIPDFKEYILRKKLAIETKSRNN